MKRVITSAIALLSVISVEAAKAPSLQYRSDIPSNNFEPAGWVEEFLNRQASGLTGHPEQSGFPFNTDLWIGGDLDFTQREIPGGKGWFPYEQVAYYMDGALRCGYMINNREMRAVARKNIDYVIASADKDGRFQIPNIDDDWWPLVVFVRIMCEEYDNTRDPRILEALERHYKSTYKDVDGDAFTFDFSGFASRSILHVENLCYLSQLTDDKWYLECAEALYKAFEDKAKKPLAITARGMNEGVRPSGHAVTYHESMKLPAVLYYYTGKEYYRTALERAYEMLIEDDMLSSGLASGVEHVHGNGSEMAHELCNSIDFNWTSGWALLATGDARYADLVERSIYNAGFSSITSDFKAHQYYGAPNMPYSTDRSSWYNADLGWGSNGMGRMCYRPGHDTECCSGNVHRLLPTFINRSAMVNKDGDISINYYIPGAMTIETKGEKMTYRQETNYPFEFSSRITFEDVIASKVNLALRIPGWATSYDISLNGKSVASGKNSGACYKTISRKFSKEDVIEVSFTAEPKFVDTADGVAVNYGALVYSYAIPYKYSLTTCDGGVHKCSEEFPAYQYYPVSGDTWQYAIDTKGGIEVVTPKSCSDEECDDYPWEKGNSPVTLQVKARKVKNWKAVNNSYAPAIPETLELEDDVETLTLEPLGTTLIRITDFPKIK